ncbi:hypothetical protein ACB094_11G058300 [Castanea mollissima]
MKRAELVFIPAPGIGHLVSKIEFAKQLLDQDNRFSITVLVIKPPYGANMDAYIHSLVASESRIKLIHLPHVDPPPQELYLRSVEKYIADLIESHKTHVKEAIINQVLPNSSSIPLAGLVVDMFCTAMIDVAHELGVPSYVFFTSGAAFLGFMFYLPKRYDQLGTEFRESDHESDILSYVNPVPTSVLPSFVFNKEGGHVCMVNHGRKFKEAKGIIVNTFLELESHAISSFLDHDIPPVYTLGPLIKLKKIALGLEQSGHRFLWSIRCASSDDKFAAPNDCMNLEDVLPQGFLERTSEIGMLCGWAPQVEVLAHKATAAFVSHCGWNSTLESLWYGVPIATWPIYAEQQINAFEMVRDLGLAVELRLDYRVGGEVVMAEEIKKAVECVMQGDSEVRKRVKEISEKSRKAVMNGGSSSASLGRLIEDISRNMVLVEK